jgi:hypothetical protein
MEFFEMFGNAGMVARVSLLIAVLPLAAGVAYAIRPTEARLALMRPISLAGLFAAFSGTTSGAISMLRVIGIGERPLESSFVAIGAAEALVPLFVAFGCLTVAWLCAALGLRRHA